MKRESESGTWQRVSSHTARTYHFSKGDNVRINLSQDVCYRVQVLIDISLSVPRAPLVAVTAAEQPIRIEVGHLFARIYAARGLVGLSHFIGAGASFVTVS